MEWSYGTFDQLCFELDSLKSDSKREVLSSFFKTGKGQYAEGDVFLGIPVPVLRSVCVRYTHLSFDDIAWLLKSEVHEHRFVALTLLVMRFNSVKGRGMLAEKKRIYDFYLSYFSAVNNWDLVDMSCSQIVGQYMLLVPSERKKLFLWVKSTHLWTRRIAVGSCYAFIRKKEFSEILGVCRLLFTDSHDLMHKVCGWMLREVGKRDVGVLRNFLDLHAASMPRTMLRYAIEKFDSTERARYLKAK